MSGCLDRCFCVMPDSWTESLRGRRNGIASVFASLFFTAGWWVMIDAAIKFPSWDDLPHPVYTCGVIGTVALMMINAVSSAQVRGDSYVTGGCFGTTGARIWLFLGFLLAFGAVISATWVLFGLYVVPNKSTMFPGVAIFIQNVLIFIGGIVFKFGRSEEQF